MRWGCISNLQQSILFFTWLTTDVIAADGLAILLWLQTVLISNDYEFQMSVEVKFIDTMFRCRSETEVSKDFLGATQDVSGTGQTGHVLACRAQFYPRALASSGCMCQLTLTSHAGIRDTKCDVQGFEFMISVSVERSWKREGFEGILVLSSTISGSYRGDGARLFSKVHGKRQEVTDTSYSKKNSACM